MGEFDMNRAKHSHFNLRRFASEKKNTEKGPIFGSQFCSLFFFASFFSCSILEKLVFKMVISHIFAPKLVRLLAIDLR